ncbi:MAG: 50S ribosomal protein L21 [Nitrospirota bacterium]
MYAVLKTGGKQYRVSAGEFLHVEKYPAAVGDKVEFGSLLLIQNEESVVTDPDQLKNAKVVCQVVQQGRDRKILVFKKKRRKNYRKTQGHRQSFTRLQVLEIVA